MKTLKYFFTFILLFFSALYAVGIPKLNDNKTKIPPDPIYKNTILIPQGYSLNVTFKENPSCDNALPFDDMTVLLNNDFIYKGTVIANEGSLISGKIVKNETQENTCKVKFKFTKIITKNGTVIPISAIFTQEDKSGYILSFKRNRIFENNNADIIIKQPVTFIKK